MAQWCNPLSLDAKDTSSNLGETRTSSHVYASSTVHPAESKRNLDLRVKWGADSVAMSWANKVWNIFPQPSQACRISIVRVVGITEVK